MVRLVLQLAILALALEVYNMRGTIRIVVGFLMVFGAAGGIDTASDSQIFPLVGIAMIGLICMYSGVKATNS